MKKFIRTQGQGGGGAPRLRPPGPNGVPGAMSGLNGHGLNGHGLNGHGLNGHGINGLGHNGIGPNGNVHNGHNGHIFGQNGHLNGIGTQFQPAKITKLNGHANGASNGRPWMNGFATKHDEKQSTISRYWSTEKGVGGREVRGPVGGLERDRGGEGAGGIAGAGGAEGEGYLVIKRRCQAAGALWEDPDFPAGPRALYRHKKPPLHPIVWMRPHEMCTRPLFRGDSTSSESGSSQGGCSQGGCSQGGCSQGGCSPAGSCCHPAGLGGLAGRFSVEPGELGDPHLLAAAASLAFTPRLLDRVVPPDQDFHQNYCGMFRFRFWQFGEWREVLVDDRLPTWRGRLQHLHCTSATDFWPALLEKAYAKFYGSYEALGSGAASTTRSLQDLTGGIVQSFALSHQDRYLTFQVLNSAVPRSSLLIATIASDKEKRQLRLRNGLITAQAYSVTGLARVRGAGSSAGGGAGGGGGAGSCAGVSAGAGAGASDTPLVRLRNPTGRGEWAGAWAPSSWEWHALSARDKDLLSVRVTNDGEFWMSFEDFARVFTRLELVHVGPDDWMAEAALHAKRPWRAVLARRRWRAGYNAGGGPSYLETTAMNPQFHVQIPRAAAAKCHVVVSVTQHYEPASTCPGAGGSSTSRSTSRPTSRSTSRARHKKGLIAIGFAVYEVPPSLPRLTMQFVADQKPLDVTNHSVAREVVTFFTLPPGDYIVVPQTSAPNLDAKFLLRILTDEQTNIWEVNEDNMIIRNISTEFMEDRQLLQAELRATLTRLLGKRQTEEVDAAGLRRVLRRCWRSCLVRRPSLELCRSLVMLRDANISGRIPARDIPPLIHVLQFWKHIFVKLAGGGGGGMGGVGGVGGSCGGKTSSYKLRALLWAAGATASNKVLECLVVRFAKERVLTAEAYVMAMARLHLAHERYHSLDTKMKTNPLSLEEMILMTIYS